ncbi:ricin-type beta-trefoil lectin domain protein [Actinoplanes sp. NPDC051494]|uniref:ricin-type beta-trefoil lectin domain protein n=1 Tax=Actinoplanes sp. NPDC051494 TaxID=3363907 RepID=UPI00379567C7
MADSWDDTTAEPRDPVLVRPYITTEPATPEIAGHDDRPDETWPHTAMLPEEPAAAATTEMPRVTAAPATSKGAAFLRQRILVLAGVAVLALAAAGGIFLTTGSEPEDDLSAPINPSFATPGETTSPGAAATRSGSPAATTAPSQGAKASSAAASARPGSSPDPAGAPASAPPPQNQAPLDPATTTTTPATTAPTPTATLNPPPATDRTGPVTSSAGRCLAFGGLLGIDGTPIQVSGCSKINYQSFTLTTAGTLTVAGHCTEATTAGEVRSVTCDDRESAQWRTGPGNSLVNPATGLCLTDPGTSGATARVTPCDGSAAQTWTLP